MSIKALRLAVSQDLLGPLRDRDGNIHGAREEGPDQRQEKNGRATYLRAGLEGQGCQDGCRDRQTQRERLQSETVREKHTEYPKEMKTERQR